MRGVRKENKSTILTFNPMTKLEIITQISEKTGIDKSEVSTVVEAYHKAIKDNVAAGKRVDFRTFGSYRPKLRKQKVARNITKGTPIIIDEHYMPSFKPAKEFSNKVKESVKA
jgi:DNA-binding protein HU-beta